jgi:lipopolysaccharide export system protein LptC
VRSLWLGVLGILLIIAAAAWEMAAPERGGPEGRPEPVAVRVSEATIVLRDRGAKQAEIAADRVELSADRQTTTFTGQPRAVIYIGGVRAMTATGGRIVLQRQGQAVKVEGGLRIVTEHGETLSARTATWDQESQVVDLIGDVQVTFPIRRSLP